MPAKLIRSLAATATAVALLSACATAPTDRTAADARRMGASVFLPSCGGAQPHEVLQRVNEARARRQQCGRKAMPAAPALRWDAALYSAATGHSADMARRNYFDHRSPEGLQVRQRVGSSNYKFRVIGENLAGGDTSVEEVVQGWLDSPDHCENMMNPEYVDVAVACVAQSGSTYGTYWTMLLGRPR
jgi:uncharacterized protein YkwD